MLTSRAYIIIMASFSASENVIPVSPPFCPLSSFILAMWLLLLQNNLIVSPHHILLYSLINCLYYHTTFFNGEVVVIVVTFIVIVFVCVLVNKQTTIKTLRIVET